MSPRRGVLWVAGVLLLAAPTPAQPRPDASAPTDASARPARVADAAVSSSPAVPSGPAGAPSPRAIARAAARRAAARAPDRFEAQDHAFFARVRDGYAARASAEPARFVHIDAAGSPAAVAASVLAMLEAHARW